MRFGFDRSGCPGCPDMRSVRSGCPDMHSGRSGCSDMHSDRSGMGSVPSAALVCMSADSESGSFPDSDSFPGSGSRPGSDSFPGSGSRPGSDSFPGSGSRPGSDSFPDSGFPYTAAVHIRNGSPVLCTPAESLYSHSRFHVLLLPGPDLSL